MHESSQTQRQVIVIFFGSDAASKSTMNSLKGIEKDVTKNLLCIVSIMKIEDNRELNQARSKHDIVDRPVRTGRTFVHRHNSTQYCSTETVILIFFFLHTNITSQMWPSGSKRVKNNG